MPPKARNLSSIREAIFGNKLTENKLTENKLIENKLTENKLTENKLTEMAPSPIKVPILVDGCRNGGSFDWEKFLYL